MLNKSILFAAGAAILSIAGAPTAAGAATLTGSTVTGRLTPDSVFTVTTPFAASAIVGAGTEFTSALHDTAFGQNFTVTADFSETELLIGFSSASSSANISAGRPLVSVSFGSAAGLFAPIGGLTLVSCTYGCGARTASSFSANANAISAGFNSIYAGDVYRVALAAVPEPATWAMMMLGFGGMGYAMRRRPRQSARIRFA